MNYLYHLIRKYPLSCILIAVIWVLCFITPPHTQLDNVPLMDKWTHIAMYGGTCTVIWIEYLKRHKKINAMRLFCMAWLAPVVMSGVIELLQAYCTGGRRTGDCLAFAAPRPARPCSQQHRRNAGFRHRYSSGNVPRQTAKGICRRYEL